MLGEVELLAGECELHGKIAYSPQEAWIMAGTVLSNILFGEPYDSFRLARVIDVCALTTDIEQFADGLQTEIGEKGVNLSGGQRARISLARTCYAKVDIVLLDDPLSAVIYFTYTPSKNTSIHTDLDIHSCDVHISFIHTHVCLFSHTLYLAYYLTPLSLSLTTHTHIQVDPSVAKHIFFKCILGWLAQEQRAAVVLVTHQRQFMPNVDRIVLMDGGVMVKKRQTVLQANFKKIRTDVRMKRKIGFSNVVLDKMKESNIGQHVDNDDDEVDIHIFPLFPFP